MQPGSRIPDLTFLSPDGSAVSLRDLLDKSGDSSKRGLLVIFLRHLA
jgi:hypothetical protein